jgi:hypothetical protein
VSWSGMLRVGNDWGGGIVWLWYRSIGCVVILGLEWIEGSELVGAMWLREERPVRRPSNQ